MIRRAAAVQTTTLVLAYFRKAMQGAPLWRAAYATPPCLVHFTSEGRAACRRRDELEVRSLSAGSRAVCLLLVMVFWASHAAVAAPLLDEPIQPIPLTLKQDPARADIGRQLFRDVRLSGNGRVSCASCHDLSKGGGDGRDRSVGLNGGLTSVNAPTVLNAALNFKQFW